MKFKSQLVTQVSGSVGGTTYAHNRGGMYMRGRAIPTNPSTPAQVAARNALGSLAAAWRTVVTEVQRMAWEEYAANSPVTDKLGDPLILTGQQMYIRCNQPRVRAGVARVDIGPTTFGLATLSTVSMVIDTGDDTFELTFDNSEDWATATGGVLITQVGRQQQPTINFFNGPYRLAGTILGDTTTPPTSPQNIDNPFGVEYTQGMRVFYRIVASNADGRLSNVMKGFTAVA